MEHLASQLTAADVERPDELLDRIDEIVPPGVTLAQADRGYAAPALTDKFLRRRRTA